MDESTDQLTGAQDDNDEGSASIESEPGSLEDAQSSDGRPGDAESDQDDTDEFEDASLGAQETIEPDRLDQLRQAAAKLVFGEVTVHFAQRDVSLQMDGESAMRLLTIFRLGREAGLADVLTPTAVSALSGWIVLDVGLPLAMTWTPELGAARRTSIDPVITR